MPLLDGIIEDVVGGDTPQITRTITNIPSGRAAVKVWHTVKKVATDPDAQALIQKAITTLNVPGTGQIVDDGAVTGSAKVRFDYGTADTLSLIPGTVYHYDIQVKIDDGRISTPEIGTIIVRQGVTVTTT